jgi:hypothetical protein
MPHVFPSAPPLHWAAAATPGVAFEGEAVCVAVPFGFAGGFDGDVGAVGEEFGEGVVEEAFEGGEPFGVFGLWETEER